MLKEFGYVVLTATEPYEALQLALTCGGDVSLLITDVVMPGMNGRELAQRLQGIFPNLKSLFMSGYTANVIAHQGILQEGIHFIQKPFSVNALAEKVYLALNEKG